jgi:hypothetical protein
MASDQNRGLAQMDTPADDARLGSPCSMILVQGTWARGFVPKRREVSLYPPNKRWWFEEGSQFRTGLDAALKSASLDWTICPFSEAVPTPFMPATAQRGNCPTSYAKAYRMILPLEPSLLLIATEETWRCVLYNTSIPWQAKSGSLPWRRRFLGCSRAGPSNCHNRAVLQPNFRLSDRAASYTVAESHIGFAGPPP